MRRVVWLCGTVWWQQQQHTYMQIFRCLVLHVLFMPQKRRKKLHAHVTVAIDRRRWTRMECVLWWVSFVGDIATVELTPCSTKPMNRLQWCPFFLSSDSKAEKKRFFVVEHTNLAQNSEDVTLNDVGFICYFRHMKWINRQKKASSAYFDAEYVR